MSFNPFPEPEADEHCSDTVFPQLPDDLRPTKFEWQDEPGVVQMFCGCMETVWTGDTVWVIPGEPDGPSLVVAIDLRTVH